MDNTFRLSLVAFGFSLAACGPGVEAILDNAGGGSGGGSTPSRDAGMGGSDAAVEEPEALTAPAETWTWVPVEGMRCGNGSQNGVAVNLTNRSSNVLIVYEGGGGCWDWETCFETETAARISETLTSRTVLDTVASYSGATDSPSPYFKRDAANNPFRDASFVFVPYCTGDFHSGGGATTYRKGTSARTVHHVGAANMEILVPKLRATFPEANTVWVTGYSAGGLGASLNWWRYIDEFDGSEVHALNDCGTTIATKAPALWTTMKTSMQLVFPPGCTTCSEGFQNLYPFYASTVSAEHRLGLLAYRRDLIVSAYYGYVTEADVAAAALLPDLLKLARLVELTNPVASRTDAVRAAMPSASSQRALLLEDAQHVMSMQRTFSTTLATNAPTRTKVLDWVTAWATGSAGFRNIGP